MAVVAHARGVGGGKGEGEAMVEEAVCTCKYKGECNHGDCACCNAAQRCWGCSAECRKGGKAAALGGGGGGAVADCVEAAVQLEKMVVVLRLGSRDKVTLAA